MTYSAHPVAQGVQEILALLAVRLETLLPFLVLLSPQCLPSDRSLLEALQHSGLTCKNRIHVLL